MLLKPKTSNSFMKYVSGFIVYFLFTLLFRDERMLGFWGVTAMNVIAAFILIMLYVFIKYENVRLVNEVLELRHKEKVLESIAVNQIQSFTIENVSSASSIADGGNKVKTVYMIRGSKGEVISFSKKLYSKEEVLQLLQYCLSQNPTIYTNIKEYDS